jgi:hypothetical protein
MTNTDSPSEWPQGLPRLPVAPEAFSATGPAITPLCFEAERRRRAGDRVDNGHRSATPR